jgi:hypothetical protein
MGGALVKLWHKIAIGLASVGAIFAASKPKPPKPPGGGVDPTPDPDDEDAGPSSPGLVVPLPKPWKGIPFAVGDDPVWPLQTTHARGHQVPYVDVDGRTHGNGSRRFGAFRKGPPAHDHQGVDLYCNVGDRVLACEAGKITGLWNTFHLGTGAVVLVTDSGITIVYGEIGPGTWNMFGIVKGQRVSKGQPIAAIAKNSAGTWMLHFETYAGAFSTNDPPKSALLDPTLYLLEALHDG